MTKFDFRALPWNIVFETDGIDRLPGELEELGLHRALVLTTSNRAG